MSNRTAIQSAIVDFVEGAAAAGIVIDVDLAAIRLSSDYPQSGFTIDELCRLIETAAVERRAVILSQGEQRSA
jgi:hypothetical protein